MLSSHPGHTRASSILGHRAKSARADRMRMCLRSVVFSASSFACSLKLEPRTIRRIFTPTIRTMSESSESIRLSYLREACEEGSVA